MRVALGLALAGALAGGPAFAWNSPAPDVVLYGPPSLAAALGRIADRFADATRVPVHLFLAPPDGLIGLLRHRARADVLVADQATLDTLAQARLLRPGTAVALGRNPYVLAAAAAAAPADDAARLVAGHAVVLTDPTTAAEADGAGVLRAALPGAAPRTIGVADTPGVLATLATAPALVGVVPRSAVPADGVVAVATLAAPAVPIGAALASNGQSAQAGALLGFIAGAPGRTVLREAGLEAAP